MILDLHSHALNKWIQKPEWNEISPKDLPDAAWEFIEMEGFKGYEKRAKVRNACTDPDEVQSGQDKTKVEHQIPAAKHPNVDRTVTALLATGPLIDAACRCKRKRNRDNLWGKSNENVCCVEV